MKVIWILLLACICTEGLCSDRLDRFMRIEARRYERSERKKVRKLEKKLVPLRGTYIPEGYYTQHLHNQKGTLA